MHSPDPLRRVSRNPFAAAWDADYDRALAGLYGLVAPGASLVRARIFGRLGLAERLIAEYRALRTASVEVEEAAEIASLAAIAFARLGRMPECDRARGVAAEFGAAGDDPVLDAQLAHESSVVDLHLGRFDASEATLHEAFRALEACPPTEATAPYRFEINHIRARILDHLRFHAARRNDRAEQERLSTEAVLCVNLVRHRDMWIESGMLVGLAVVVYQFDSVVARELLRVRAQTIAWTSHIERRRVHVAGALRTNDLLFKAARDVDAPSAPPSPTLAFRVSRCVMELLYADWPDRDSYEREREFAIDIAHLADWDGGDGEEFIALGKLVAIVAAADRGRARDLHAIYCRQRARAPIAVLALSPGLRVADEAFMDGCLAKADGDDGAASAALARSRGAFETLEIDHRAAIISLERFALTREPADLQPARRFRSTHDDTPFGHRLGRVLASIARGTPARFPYLAAFGRADDGDAAR